MENIVKELQELATNGDVKVTELLRKALIISKKCGSIKFVDWINCELNGYTNYSLIPQYREVRGIIKVFNPVRGLIPLTIEDTDIAEILSKRKINQSVEEMESLINNNKESKYLIIPFPPELENRVMNMMEYPMQPQLRIPPTEIVKILNAVRNKILEWVITLENVDTKEITVDKNKVFIVHGHDELIKTETARFVEKMGFEAIILHEQASSGKTIIEKIEEYSNVGFGIILYTPCDIGSKASDKPKLNSRARQNVIFEHGYLIGKLGRKNVCALVKDNIELPTDTSGIIYISIDNHNAWQLQIAKEMRKAGYEIDLNKI